MSPAPSLVNSEPVARLRLTAHEIELDPAPEKFGWLQESAAGDAAAGLQQRMKEEGYIFLRQFWSRSEVLPVRDSLTAQLERLGFLLPGTPRDETRARPGREVGRATGNPLDQKDPLLNALLFGPRMMAFAEKFLGGPVRHFDYIWFRTKGPGIGSPIHCDIVYMGRGTHNLFTAWVPLGDIELDLGGLIVLERSHLITTALSHYRSRDVDTYCSNQEGADDYAAGRKWWDGTLSKNARALQESLGGRWLTAREFKLGDVVLFNMTLVHGSLDNHTDRIRLSTDTRYQLASEPADERWVGEKPAGHTSSMKRGRVC